VKKSKKISLSVDEQIWKELKIFHVKCNVRSPNNLFTILSLKLLRNEITIPKSYNVHDDELIKFLEGIKTSDGL